MDWLYSLLDNSSVPVVTALILGLLTALSPCPLATNLTAVAYLGRELENRRKVLLLGMLYTLGRTIAYSLLGAVLIFLIRMGEDAFGIQDTISTIGEWILGPALILIGLFMLFGHLLHLPKFGFSGQASGSWTQGALGAFILCTFLTSTALDSYPTSENMSVPRRKGIRYRPCGSVSTASERLSA